MKKFLKSLTVITIISGLSVSNVFANDFNVKVKSNDEIVSVLNKKGKKFVKKNAEDLSLYLAVMEMYENTPSKFYNLDKETQVEFLEASTHLIENMTSARKKAIRNLASDMDFNSAIGKFIWDVKDASFITLPLGTTDIIKTNI